MSRIEEECHETKFLTVKDIQQNNYSNEDFHLIYLYQNHIYIVPYDEIDQDTLWEGLQGNAQILVEIDRKELLDDEISFGIIGKVVMIASLLIFSLLVSFILSIIVIALGALPGTFFFPFLLLSTVITAYLLSRIDNSSSLKIFSTDDSFYVIVFFRSKPQSIQELPKDRVSTLKVEELFDESPNLMSELFYHDKEGEKVTLIRNFTPSGTVHLKEVREKIQNSM